jgi:hypothetical protein
MKPVAENPFQTSPATTLVVKPESRTAYAEADMAQR